MVTELGFLERLKGLIKEKIETDDEAGEMVLKEEPVNQFVIAPLYSFWVNQIVPLFEMHIGENPADEWGAKQNIQTALAWIIETFPRLGFAACEYMARNEEYKPNNFNKLADTALENMSEKTRLDWYLSVPGKHLLEEADPKLLRLKCEVAVRENPGLQLSGVELFKALSKT